ncbi:f-box-like domain-containing protein [Ditylenchus destructor]|uniref:F-box-like domain-containing protein n=1 Tax=Ditylenchus destructor TaxID=166010 RepID=A0AAD4N7M5_9BILA|nr:f-box-like domain-containing protein [Ditylenchus destructor]
MDQTYSPGHMSYELVKADEDFLSTTPSDYSILRRRPETSPYYRTPGPAISRFLRRRYSVEPTSSDYLGNGTIPTTVMYKICSYLNKKDLLHLMSTCKRFRDIGKDSSFWQFLNLYGKHISCSSLHAIIDRKVQVLRLNSATINVEVFPPWHNFPILNPAMLTHLDMSSSKFENPSVLLEILQRCHNLYALSLELCGIIDDQMCKEIAKNTNLYFLNLAMAKSFSAEGIVTILSSCRKLGELNIGWTELSGDVINLTCQLLPPSLKRLSFSGTRDKAEMNDDNIKRICDTCKQLEELDLSDDVVITENCLDHVKNLKNLRILTISRCYGIEPMAFLSLQNLDIFNVYGCVTVEGIDVLRSRLRPTRINVSPLSSIAIPTDGESVTSIWKKRTRDWY